MGNRNSRKRNQREKGPQTPESATYKLLIVGDSSVGKTSLLKRFIERTFSTDYEVTLGVDFKSHKINYKGIEVNLSMWDTAGQERFRDFTTAYYKTADGIVILFDVTNEETFNNVGGWLDTIGNHTKDAKKVLVGNKCDLSAKRIVTRERAEEYAAGVGLKYVEASAKDGSNVDDVFTKIVEELSYRE